MLAVLSVSSILYANYYTNEDDSEKRAYVKLASGVSIATKAKVCAPSAFWDPAVQGYDSDLGIAPIFYAAFDYDIIPAITIELSASYRPHYSYKKFQTPLPDIDTPGALGDKTRRFNLDITSVLASLYLNGRTYDKLRWNMRSAESYMYPFIGLGIGASELTISNFRSTGLPPSDPSFITPDITIPGFASENQYTKRYRFTYQVFTGFEYRLLPDWGFGLGYRWFSTTKFRGPSYLRDTNGNSADIICLEWRLRFAANEVFVHLDYYF